MKSLLLVLIACIFSGPLNSIAQSGGKISGRVTLVDGQPFGSASVSLIETQQTTLTNDGGHYSFANVPEGAYTIRIQVLGAAQKDLKVQVTAGQTTTANYQLPKENVQALQEVIIGGNNKNKFAKKESIYVARLPIKNLENPQVYASIPKELIQEQMATDLASIAKNVAGAGIPMVANQGRVTFRSRGFDTEPNARNGVAGAAFAMIDPVNLERLEVIKGPSATLFGTSISSSYGGLYNRVTKKPYNGVGGEVGYTGGSWNFNRLTFDVNSPINESKTALFRLNGATSFEKSFQDQGFTNSLTLAPSFSYQVNDRLSLLFDIEFGQAKGTSVVRYNPAATPGRKSIADMGFPYNRTFLSNDLPYTTQLLNIFAQANYKISESWTSQTIVSRARSSISGYITALNGRTDTTIRPNVITGYTQFIATNIQQNFIGDFKVANLRNRLVVGFDFYNNYNDFDRVTVNTTAGTAASPDLNFKNPYAGRISKFKVDSLASRGGTLRKETNRDNTYAVYFSDVINLTDRLNIMLSLRANRYKFGGVYNIVTGMTAGGLNGSGTQTGPYNQNNLSQKLGAVYEISKDRLSIFGNYMNGFFNKSGQTSDGSALKPEHANQLEFGAKADLFDHKLSGTVSYYDIKVADVLRDDPNSANGYQIQDGTQLSRGVEVDLSANPIAGLNIVAGFAYNDSKLTKASPTTTGRRPGVSGPPRSYNFWVSYRIPQGELQGLGAGFGGNIASWQYYSNTTVSQIIIPSYAMFDATVFYDQPRYRIGLKVDNLTSEKTWSVRLTPQAPARFLGSVALKF
ncbi:TonB-dependent receptor [Pedobacter sp. MC2016-15]|uniref:TonB-dependent receptor n=1 Tax=Pedobacter sp. MC2016-15 TaxID=2994473 RepID=UPI002247A5BF|nr:TonB-dependent receptor [Pedobacter sp. MC2016-15]MCX2480952.1 TonB-dependent receptor [Pedobacter sp. MC2016-15]